jgi:hypothetical protein
MPRDLIFVAKSTALYCVAYLLAGGIAYQLLTRRFYVGADPIFTAYLRSESNPGEWAHTTVWLVPALALRAVLISLALLPFVGALRKMATTKRVAVTFTLLFVLTHLGAAAPSPSNIEGLVYMRPELIRADAFLLTQPEMVLQCILFALGLSRFVGEASEA